MILGIDAASMKNGGVVTHLVELLRAADPAAHGITKVVVWGGAETLGKIEPRPWLKIRPEAALDRGLLRRLLWQWRILPQRLKEERCDVVLVPGGYHFNRFRPAVVMNQNLIPFVPEERRRYGWSRGALRLWLLRWSMIWSSHRSEALLAQTENHRRALLPVAAPRGGAIVTVNLGIERRFFLAPRPARRLEDCTVERPFRILYVSTVDLYKHQWHVAEAVAMLAKEGLPVRLDLIGTSIGPALGRLTRTLAQLDPEGRWIRYRGMIAHEEIAPAYQEADLFVFASSCEAFGQVLTEAMAAGLPIVCAERAGLPEILGEAGVYVDPEDPSGIAGAIRALLTDPARRGRLASAAYARAGEFTWARCARETFAVVANVA